MTFIKEFEKNLFECCKCGWTGQHDEKATKDELYGGVDSIVDICPECGCEEFYQIANTPLSGDNNG